MEQAPKPITEYFRVRVCQPEPTTHLQTDQPTRVGARDTCVSKEPKQHRCYESLTASAPQTGQTASPEEKCYDI